MMMPSIFRENLFDDFMDGFMNKLKADSFAKDNQPNKESEVNEEFFNEQLPKF